MTAQYTEYEKVPWLRRSGTVNVLVLAGFFGVAPLLWTACIVCLTGDIFTDEVGEDGFLVKTPQSTKNVALIALGLHCLIILYVIWDICRSQ